MGQYKGAWLITLNIGLIISVMSVLEIKHQMFIRRDLQFKIETAAEVYTHEELER